MKGRQELEGRAKGCKEGRRRWRGRIGKMRTKTRKKLISKRRRIRWRRRKKIRC